jgi:hypothetical protein
MATPLFIPIFRGSDSGTGSSTTAIGTGAVGVFQLGNNVVIRVVATVAVNIRFGDSSITTATAQDIYLPANTVELFDMGTNTAIAVFAAAASSFNLSIVSRT